MTGVIEHLESFCGPIVEGWRLDPDGKQMPFQVVRLERGHIAGTVAFSTLGLSNYPLRSATSPQVIRHELLMLARRDSASSNLPAVLHQVGAEALARESAYLRGEIIGPRGMLFTGSALEALFVSAPVYFPKEFFGTSTQKIGRVIFAWLVPITTKEAGFVTTNGWSKFEDLLSQRQPDLLDYQRHSIVE
jgi:hypothetical protein